MGLTSTKTLCRPCHAVLGNRFAKTHKQLLTITMVPPTTTPTMSAAATEVVRHLVGPIAGRWICVQSVVLGGFWLFITSDLARVAIAKLASGSSESSNRLTSQATSSHGRHEHSAFMSGNGHQLSIGHQRERRGSNP